MENKKQRERLVELLNEAKREGSVSYQADYLIERNVVVLPFKIGDRVYVPWSWFGTNGIAVVEVQEIRFYDKSGHWMFFIELQSDDEDYNQAFGGWKIKKCIGKTVFLSRAEAEAKLRDMQNDNK